MIVGCATISLNLIPLHRRCVPPGSTAQGSVKRGDLSGKLIEKSCQEILGGYIRLTARLRT